MAIHRKVVVDVRNWLQSTKRRGMALGLKGTKTVLERLNLSLPANIIHVAGSNGKGTLCALLATNFTLIGKSNLLFSSPHLCRVEERVRLNGIPVRSSIFDETVKKIQLVSLCLLYTSPSPRDRG